jgi:hypothetical protein
MSTNTRKLLEVDLDYGSRTVWLNPTFESEVAATHDDDEEYTLSVTGAPWEIRGTLSVDEDQQLSGGHFSVYVPTESDAVDWGDDVGGTQNIVQVTMNGAAPWRFQLHPSFREDLSKGLQQEADEYEEGEAYVEITIDDESPWRIKHGQITIGNDDGAWVVRSSPLMIAVDELDWEFSFEEWAEE